jgi:4-hydroxy-3-polyprenylbenzoate decarboxylase
MDRNGRWIIGITGASGVVYGTRLLEVLSGMGFSIDLILSEAGRIVLKEELGYDLSPDVNSLKNFIKLNDATVRIYDNKSFEVPPASGSYQPEGMIIAPCSMATLAALAYGFADNLIRRSGDVMIKQQLPLILLPRETPLSAIHLENMLKLSRLGVTILPPMPAFYHAPSSVDDLVDFVIGRVLDVMGVDHSLYKRWQGEK